MPDSVYDTVPCGPRLCTCAHVGVCATLQESWSLGAGRSYVQRFFQAWGGRQSGVRVLVGTHGCALLTRFVSQCSACRGTVLLQAGWPKVVVRQHSTAPEVAALAFRLFLTIHKHCS